MRKYFFILLSLFALCCNSVDNKNKVKVILDKSKYAIGETVTAKIYLDHIDQIAPLFYVIQGKDTIPMNQDETDNYCGLYQALCWESGEKIVNGLVTDVVDSLNQEHSYNFTIQFTVK